MSAKPHRIRMVLPPISPNIVTDSKGPLSNMPSLSPLPGSDDTGDNTDTPSPSRWIGVIIFGVIAVVIAALFCGLFMYACYPTGPMSIRLTQPARSCQTTSRRRAHTASSHGDPEAPTRHSRNDTRIINPPGVELIQGFGSVDSGQTYKQLRAGRTGANMLQDQCGESVEWQVTRQLEFPAHRGSSDWLANHPVTLHKASFA